MFTLKWVAGNGSQHLYADVANVDYTPPGESQNKTAAVAFDLPGINSSCSIDTGRVYVMNGDGRTVERYILHGDREFPEGLEPAA